MRFPEAQLFVILLAMALILPSAGPLLDHHFAERSPGHHHLGPNQYHAHTYGPDHVHLRAQAQSSDTGNPSTALYNYDSGPVGTIVVASENAAMQSFLQFEPTSLFMLPSPYQARLHSAYTSPPEKPPQRHI